MDQIPDSGRTLTSGKRCLAILSLAARQCGKYYRLMKTIVFTSASAKQFDALPLAAQAAIEAALGRYAVHGHGDVKRLSGREGYRLRIGQYRVLFDESRTTILAVYIGRRATHTYS